MAIRALHRGAHLLALAGAVLAAVVLVVVTVGPRTGRFQVLTVLTGSMDPSAPRGSLAVVVPKARDDLKVGDVLTYAIPVEDHHVVTHRVVEVSHDRPGVTVVRTRGDANDASDPWTAELREPTVWTERLAIPHLGQAIAALRSPFVHRVGQFAPMALAAAVLQRLWRRDRSPHDALAS